MEVVAVLLGIYSIFSTLGFAILYAYNMDLSIEVKYRREENEKMKAEIEQYKEELDQKKQFEKEIKFLEKNINISNQLDRMNNLLELEMKYNPEYKRNFD